MYRDPHNANTQPGRRPTPFECVLLMDMTSDERLKGAFDALTNHLRQEIGRQVQSVLDELAAAAHADRDHAVAEARAAAARTAGDQLAAAVAEARAAAARTAGDQLAAAVADARAAAARTADDQLAAAVALAEARAREQGHDAGYAGGKAEGRQQGEEEARAALDAALADARTARGSSDVAASARFVDAIRSIGRARSLSEILDTLVSCAGREAARAGVLLVRGGRFRVWRLIGFGPALDDDSSLELSFDAAGVLADAVRTNAAVTGDHQRAAPSFASLPPGHESVAVPIALSGQVVAVLYADQGTANPANPESPIPNPKLLPIWPGTIEVLARHAARSLEAMTAFKAARALMEQSDAADAQASGASEGAGGDEDASARRYARLLVSEIKLYHEAAVVAGRRDGDLGQRLGDEIARARVLYEQRVPLPVRQRADYFRDELVRTLANGDARLLGSQ